MVLGDFNLHHPLWCGVRTPTLHLAAEPFLDTLQSYDLDLVSPQGIPTWEARGFSSTIDLTFITPGLQDRLANCQVRIDLDYGLDHYLITTELLLDTVRLLFQPRRC
jgi:hypothetical protein